MLIVLFASGCGNNSVTPYMMMMIDGQSHNVATTTTTGVVPTQFTAQFTVEMNLASAQAPGAITFVCGDLPAAEFSVSRGAANQFLLITVTNPLTYACMECVMTFTTVLQSITSTPMPYPVTFTFTNACEFSTDINPVNTELFDEEAVKSDDAEEEDQD